MTKPLEELPEHEITVTTTYRVRATDALMAQLMAVAVAGGVKSPNDTMSPTIELEGMGTVKALHSQLQHEGD